MSFLEDLFGVTKAKNAATNAANQNRAESASAYADAQNILNPYLVGGQQGYGLLNNLLGVNGTGAQQQAFQNYQQGPDVKFRMQQGIDAIDNSSAARTGGVLSGGLLKRLQEFGTGVATQDLGNYLNRLAGTSAMGQQAANTLTGARYNTANLTTGANSQEGNAIANASLAGGNILGNIIGGAFGLAGNLGWNPFGANGGGSMSGTLNRNTDPWSGIR